MSLSGPTQDEISLAAQKCVELIKVFQEHDGDVEIIQRVFNGTAGQTVIINGITITQPDLDAIASFQTNELTLQNIADAAFAIGTFRTNMLGILDGLRALAKIE